MLTKKVFTPGPTQVPKSVLDEVTSHITYHRSKEFKEFHLKLISKLKSIFFTNQHLHILTASGTGAMETAVANFCRPGEKTLFVNQGRFGSRWGSLCRAYGLDPIELYIEPGGAVQIDDLTRINLGDIQTVFFTHTETSTGTLTDLRTIADYVKNNSDALVIADTVASIGAVEFRMDDWRIDVAVSASQKGLMSPPGLSMIAYSQKAHEKMQSNPMSRFYFDLRKFADSLSDGFTPWTPAIGIMFGMDKACDIVTEFGIERWWDKVSACANYVRSEAVSEGFGLFSKYPTDSLTALTMPDNIPSGLLLSKLKEKYGIQIANGQAEFKDKIFRISHMGDLDLSDFKQLFSLISEEFKQISISV